MNYVVGNINNIDPTNLNTTITDNQLNFNANISTVIETFIAATNDVSANYGNASATSFVTSIKNNDVNPVTILVTEIDENNTLITDAITAAEKKRETPTPTATVTAPTPTMSNTPTYTMSMTPTVTSTNTLTSSITPSPTHTQTISPSPTVTVTAPTPTATVSPSVTAPSPTISATPTTTPSISPSPTITESATVTITHETPSITPTTLEEFYSFTGDSKGSTSNTKLYFNVDTTGSLGLYYLNLSNPLDLTSSSNFQHIKTIPNSFDSDSGFLQEDDVNGGFFHIIQNISTDTFTEGGASLYQDTYFEFEEPTQLQFDKEFSESSIVNSPSPSTFIQNNCGLSLNVYQLELRLLPFLTSALFSWLE